MRRPIVGSFAGEVGLHERYWEKHLGAQTAGWAPVALSDAVVYEGTPYLLLMEIMRWLDPAPADVFMDLGCGKGRVLAMAMRTRAGRLVGVEQDADFLAAAQRNLRRDPPDARVTLQRALAQSCNFDDVTILFLFNPFGAATLREVLARVEDSLRRHPRRLRIVYVNPVHEGELKACAWLRHVEAWPSDAFPEHPFVPPPATVVSMWECADPARAA